MRKWHCGRSPHRSGEIPIESAIPYILLIVFIAIFIRSAIGFGDALFGIPLLALRVPLRQVVPFALMLSVTVACLILAQDWKKVHLRSTSWLLLPMAAGLPLGLLLLTRRHEGPAKIALAVLIIGFAAYSLFARNALVLHSDRRIWLVISGFCGGILGGAFGMSGPPVVIYGSLRRWPPQQFRATLQGYFLPAGLITLAGYWAAGLMVPAVFRDYLYSLPVALVALYLGRVAHHRLSGPAFMRFVYVGLAAIGVMLLVQSAAGHF